MRTLLLCAVLLVGCSANQPLTNEVLTVRDIWYHSGDACASVVVESENGGLRTLNFRKDQGLPLWKGMRAEIMYRRSGRLGCGYELFSVARIQ